MKKQQLSLVLCSALLVLAVSPSTRAKKIQPSLPIKAAVRKVSIPVPNVIFGEKEMDLFVRTIWAEARGEKHEGMVAVAEVILNRMRKPNAWSNSLEGVVKARLQFSCWNAADPNQRLIASLSPNSKEYKKAKRAAIEALKGSRLAARADHYHAVQVRPSWAEGVEPCARVGQHVFYLIKA